MIGPYGTALMYPFTSHVSPVSLYSLIALKVIIMHRAVSNKHSLKPVQTWVTPKISLVEGKNMTQFNPSSCFTFELKFNILFELKL